MLLVARTSSLESHLRYESEVRAINGLVVRLVSSGHWPKQPIDSHNGSGAKQSMRFRALQHASFPPPNRLRRD